MDTKKILMTNEKDNSFISTNAIYEFFAGLDGVDLTDIIQEDLLDFSAEMPSINYSYKFDINTKKKYRLSSKYNLLEDTVLLTVIVDDMEDEEVEFIAEHIIENINHYPDYILDYTADCKPFLIFDEF